MPISAGGVTYSWNDFTDNKNNDDFTTLETLEDDMCDMSPVREFRSQFEPPLYWLIVMLGAIGNLLVVWIYLYFHNRLKTMTDIYLLNLAIADLLFLGTLPFWATDAVHGWTYGTPACKLVSAIYKINFFSSMLLLTCISVDRYGAIVKATKFKNSKRERLLQSKLVCMGVWLLAAALSLPEFIFAKAKESHEGNTYCVMVFWFNQDNHIKILVLSIQICMGFCLPLLVMIFCYTVIIHTLLQSKNFAKHKALRVILAVVAVFVLSQMPFNSVLVFEVTQAANTTITDCDEVKRFSIIGQVLKSLAYSHSCLNPILYVFIGVRFRDDLFKALQSCGCCRWYGQHTITKRSSTSETETTPALSL
ncbi:C-C chemokine receptor type 9a [Paramormyrops kingsleyae]|uniref:Chemokine (C-C motif) receptor 9a n=1 Tax=Paramormyrops kingsleyae TaxID=1676925 RepID=A0A3B3RIX2_9TELE|nr:C-C chemokine receptor type 9-like [Paramormyrops kingsleyae]